MSYLVAYGAVVVVFLAIDAVWLKTVMRPLFERYVADMLRDDPRLGAAAGFYLIYCAGVVYFAVLPAAEAGGGPAMAARDGAILGLIAYGTYEATNYATLKGWDWRMVTIDVIWGTVLTAAAAAAGMAVL